MQGRLQRIAELAVGHAFNNVVSIWAFDYILYPYVIWNYGLTKGGVLMAVLSLLICLLMLWCGIAAKPLEGDRKALIRPGDQRMDEAHRYPGGDASESAGAQTSG